MNAVPLASCAFDPIVDRHDEIDRDRVHVGQFVERNRSLVCFYSPSALEYEVRASAESGRVWTDSNVVVLSELGVASIRAQCERFDAAGFTGLMPIPEIRAPAPKTP